MITTIQNYTTANSCAVYDVYERKVFEKKYGELWFFGYSASAVHTLLAWSLFLQTHRQPCSPITTNEWFQKKIAASINLIGLFHSKPSMYSFYFGTNCKFQTAIFQIWRCYLTHLDKNPILYRNWKEAIDKVFMNPAKENYRPVEIFWRRALHTRICVRSSIFNIDFHLLISPGFLSRKKGEEKQIDKGAKNPSVTRLSTFSNRGFWEEETTNSKDTKVFLE